MSADDPHPVHTVAREHRLDKTSRLAIAVRSAANGLALVILLVLLGMPAVPPPTGAIAPLWEKAARWREAKSYAQAVEVYEEIATLVPQDPEPLAAIGEIYLTQHRWPLAEDAFNRALARDEKSAQALAGLATTRWEQGDHLQAASLWEAALAQRSVGLEQHEPDPHVSALRWRLALAFLDIERPADAETLLQQEVSHSGSPAAQLYLAMLQTIDDPGGAQRQLEAIADEAPPSVVGVRDYLLDAMAKAEAVNTAAEAAKLIGLAFVQIEEWQLARGALQRALALDPADGEAMAFLGHTEAQLGRPAFVHLARSVETRPDWPLAHYLLGLYYLRQQAYDFAVEEFQVTLRQDPGNAQAMVDLARAYVGQGQYLEAEQALAAAVESEPGELSFHKALVRFYADHAYRIADQGLSAAQAATELAPEDPEIHDMLGWIHFLAGDPANARLHLESALRLDPEQASAYYHLGMLRTALGEEEAARHALLRAIDLDTDGFYRDQAQKALREMRRLDE